jgi:DNA polymerase
MIIGSAPSADDDQQGLPYSGARGRALDQLLSKAGLVPSKDVFVVNVVGCGRTSQDAPNYLVSAWDLQACYPRLEGMARITAPGAFLVMGSAARALVLARGRFAKVQYRDGDLVVERAAVRTSSIDSLLARTDYDQSGLFDSMVDDVKVAWELANAAS